MKADTICCYCICKCMTKSVTESYTNRATCRLCVMWVYLEREVSQLENTPTSSLRSHLSSSPMGIYLRDYGMGQIFQVVTDPLLAFFTHYYWL